MTPMKLLTDRRLLLVVLIAVTLVGMAVLVPSALQPGVLLNMSKFGVVVGILAIGQTIVILTGRGNIDLSVGSTLSLCGIVFAQLTLAGVNIWLAALLSIVAGAVLGAFNGVLVTVIGVPALIGTIGTLFLYGSAALVLSGGIAVGGFVTESFSVLSHGLIAGAPFQLVAIMLPLYLIVGVLLATTRWGRSVYEVGNNDRAATLVGLNPVRVRFGSFVLSGALAGLGAIVMSAWLLTSRPEAGAGLELMSLVVVVFGGTHIFGGRGTMAGTFFSVTLVTLLNTAMQMAGIAQTWQRGVLGALLVGAVLLNNLADRRAT